MAKARRLRADKVWTAHHRPRHAPNGPRSQSNQSDDGQARDDAEGEPDQAWNLAAKDNHESTERGNSRPQMPPAVPPPLTGKRTNGESELRRLARSKSPRLDGKADHRWRIDDGNRTTGHLFSRRRIPRGCRSDP